MASSPSKSDIFSGKGEGEGWRVTAVTTENKNRTQFKKGQNRLAVKYEPYHFLSNNTAHNTTTAAASKIPALRK